MTAMSHMLWPLLACLVLVGIHAYLGIHVIARKVIFVDLALAQIAALGTVYGVFLGLSIDNNSLALKLVSVGFTFIGALLISLTRTNDEFVPHEAIIGIIYAAALSSTILITSNLPHGADEVRQLLAGNILWVTSSQVLITALLYFGVGVVHFVFRKQFFLLSQNLSEKHERTINVKLWDFLFYATFGVVVTSSVSIGGVLLVFGYLVIPSVIAVLLARSTKSRLLIGWGSGAFMSIVGVIASYHLDLPSGPTIVVLLGALLAAVAIAQQLFDKERARRSLLVLLVVAIITALIAVPMIYGVNGPANAHDHRAKDMGLSALRSELGSSNQSVIAALDQVKSDKLLELLPEVLAVLTSSDDRVRGAAIEALKALGDQRAIEHLKVAAKNESDVFIEIDVADALLSLGEKHGLLLLANIADEASSEFAKDDAIDRLRDHAPDSVAFDQLPTWVIKNIDKIYYNESLKKYLVKSE